MKRYKAMNWYKKNEVLQLLGAIPFEIRTLKKRHTEKWRAQRFYIEEIVRHRGTVGAWSIRGYLRVLLMLLSTSLQSCGLQDFLKRFLPKLSATRTLRLCRSLCLRHLRDIVFMLSPPCSPPLCVPFICSRLTLSLQIPEEPKMNRKVFTLLNVFSKKNTFKTKFLSGFINA